MPWYKEYKGKLVFWAVKGAKGKGKPTGRYAKRTDRRPRVWEERRGVTYSYKRISDAQAKKLGLTKQPRKKKRAKQRRKRNPWDLF